MIGRSLLWIAAVLLAVLIALVVLQVVIGMVLFAVKIGIILGAIALVLSGTYWAWTHLR